MHYPSQMELYPNTVPCNDTLKVCCVTCKVSSRHAFNNCTSWESHASMQPLDFDSDIGYWKRILTKKITWRSGCSATIVQCFFYDWIHICNWRSPTLLGIYFPNLHKTDNKGNNPGPLFIKKTVCFSNKGLHVDGLYKAYDIRICVNIGALLHTINPRSCGMLVHLDGWHHKCHILAVNFIFVEAADNMVSVLFHVVLLKNSMS